MGQAAVTRADVHQAQRARPGEFCTQAPVCDQVPVRDQAPVGTQAPVKIQVPVGAAKATSRADEPHRPDTTRGRAPC
jgi:hypothetical protein